MTQLSQESLNWLWKRLTDEGLNQCPDEDKVPLNKLMLEVAKAIHTTPKGPLVASDQATVYHVAYPNEKKVTCIKLIREFTGLGLKEAKDLCESGDIVNSKHTFTLLISVKDAFLWGPKFAEHGITLSAPGDAIHDIVKRTTYLVFHCDSKTVELFAKPMKVAEGSVCIEVTAHIPQSAFYATTLRANVTLPPGGVGESVVTDIEQAVGMAYGKQVKLIFQPEAEDTFGL